MGSAFNIGRLFGIQIRIHYTWFIIFVLITVSLVFQVSPDWSRPTSWLVAVIVSLLFFASVLVHELSHSLVGRANGVTITSITLFLFGGVAQMRGEATSARAEFKMAAAGPAASLIIGGLFGLVWLATDRVGFEAVASAASWLALVNVALAVFNLIPGFPLDGGRVFRSVLWRTSGSYGRATRIATRLGQVVGYLFIAGGAVIVFVTGEWISGLWLAFIGWFLENAASASYRQEQWRVVLEPFTAADVMSRDYPVATADITVAELVRGYVLPTGRRYFLVVDDSRLRGMVTLHNIRSVPQAEWESTPVSAMMTPAANLKTAHMNQSALSVMELMGEGDVNQVPVVSEGRVVGVVARDNLLNFLRTHTELRA